MEESFRSQGHGKGGVERKGTQRGEQSFKLKALACQLKLKVPHALLGAGSLFRIE